MRHGDRLPRRAATRSRSGSDNGVSDRSSIEACHPLGHHRRLRDEENSGHRSPRSKNAPQNTCKDSIGSPGGADSSAPRSENSADLQTRHIRLSMPLAMLDVGPIETGVANSFEAPNSPANTDGVGITHDAAFVPFNSYPGRIPDDEVKAISAPQRYPRTPVPSGRISAAGQSPAPAAAARCSHKWHPHQLCRIR